MGAKQPTYISVLESLESKGIEVLRQKKGLFGVKADLSYPFGEGLSVDISISYSSLLCALSADIRFPYIPYAGPLMDEYDRIFPEEKNAWGRSSPKFPQAISDYMRGQTHSANKVELADGGKTVHIFVSVGGNSHGPKGLSECLAKLSFELRKGPIHEDVLTHLFAY